MIPASDQLMEDLYTFVNKAKDEPTRLELSRIALLAVQYRANQLKQQRTQRAIERQKVERNALTGASRDTQLRAALTSASGAVAPENTPAG